MQITPIIWFCIIGISFLVVVTVHMILGRAETKRLESEQNYVTPFSLLEYYSRTEKAALDILERKKPVDKTITLWKQKARGESL